VEEILTTSEVAVLLRVNVRTIYRLAEKGAIPGNKIGRSWRFIKKEVLDLLANGQRKRSRDEES
jgi:excisionase family DNA binding protein